MIRSMTGFGEAEREVPAGRLRVSIKTVNHRFLNCNVRTPAGFDAMEHEIQGWLRAHLLRGHATVNVVLEPGEDAEEDRLPRVDMDRARHMAGLLHQLRDELGLEGGVDPATLARFPEVIRVPEGRRERPDVDPGDVRAVVEDAAARVLELREAEGARLAADLEGRLAALGRELEVVEERAPARLMAERDRLRGQVRELTGSEEVDEDRLAREIAYLAEKWDINEELVRFRSHIELFRETLGGEGGEAVGKRLSFIVQEMHREANTIGSKANDAAITHASVAMKEEIERLREQVENVE